MSPTSPTMPDNQNQLETYRAYARFIRRLLLCAGIWPSSKPGAVYRQITIFSIVSGVIVLFTVGNFSFKNIANLSLLTKSLGFFGSVTAVILKTILFRVHKKDLYNIDHTLDYLFEEVLNRSRLRSVLLSLLRYFYCPAYVLTLSTAAVMFVYILRPILIMTSRDIPVTNITIPRRYVLPFPASYPWSIDSMVLYQLHYLFELQFSWFILTVTCGADTLFGFYMFRISALLRVIAYEFENLKYGDYGANEIFKNCVRIHVRLLQCRDVVQRIYGPIVLLMALTNALIMCSQIFQAFELDGMTVDKAMLSAFYMFMKIFQTFMYAWYGHVVTSESEIFLCKVYCSGWYEKCEKGVAKGILFIIMQKPICLTACSFFKISLDFFVGILHTTLSYFFLLQTLDDAE